MQTPNYKRIYKDFIAIHSPNKAGDCNSILSKQELCALDIIRLNTILFQQERKLNKNYKSAHKCYDIKTIQQILDHQKRHQLNNVETAKYFKMSRNTLAKWKKEFSKN